MTILKILCFFRKVGLCLSLFLGIILASCSVLKPHSEPFKNLRTYRLTVNMLPGSNRNDLLAALNDTAVINIDQPPLVEINIEEPGELFTLSIRLNSDTDLQTIFSQLHATGFIIRNCVLQNN